MQTAESRERDVVVTHIFCKQPFQVGFVEHDYVVQQIVAATFHLSFCHTVLPWAFERGLNGKPPQRSDSNQNFEALLRIAIED
jgi:hypothetical protein